MNPRPGPARTAAEIFVHYFRQVAERSGAQWTPQNTRDITDAVRALIKAVQPYAQSPDDAEPIPLIALQPQQAPPSKPGGSMNTTHVTSVRTEPGSK